MARRTRPFAGILALAATTLALAEMVLVSVCAPGMVMPSMGMGAMEMQPPGIHMAHAGGAAASGVDPMGSALEDAADPDEDERRCPFAPAAAQGCAGLASLPAPAMIQNLPSAEGMLRMFVEQTGHDLLLGNPLFRPPRA